MPISSTTFAEPARSSERPGDERPSHVAHRGWVGRVPVTGPVPAAEGVTREELHLRRIEMRGYRRSDGLFEIEAQLSDRKPRPFSPASSDGVVPAGVPIHDMLLTLVHDADMVVHDVRAEIRASPYAICPLAAQAMRSLIGLTIGRGWNGETRRRLAQAERCTHLAELLAPMASAALQAMSGWRTVDPDRRDAAGRPVKIDSCYAYSAERDLVRRRWPDFHHAPPPSPPHKDQT